MAHKVGPFILSLVLIALCMAGIVWMRRGRSRYRDDPPARPDYVPAFWSSNGPFIRWLAERPWRVFWYLVLIPVAGLIAGTALLLTGHSWGAFLILASPVGAYRVKDYARRALLAARQSASPRDTP